MSRYRCVYDQKAAGFPVTAACDAAGVLSTSGHYDWRAREAAGPTERQLEEAELVELMRAISEAAEGNYGAPRMHRELRRAGLAVNKKRVRRLMRLHGMAGRHHRRHCRTTRSASRVGSDAGCPHLVAERAEPAADGVTCCFFARRLQRSSGRWTIWCVSSWSNASPRRGGPSR